MNRQHTPAETTPAITEYTLDEQEVAQALRSYIDGTCEIVPNGSLSVRAEKGNFNEYKATLKVIHESPDA